MVISSSSWNINFLPMRRAQQMVSFKYHTDPQFLEALGGLIKNNVDNVSHSFDPQNVQ